MMRISRLVILLVGLAGLLVFVGWMHRIRLQGSLWQAVNRGDASAVERLLHDGVEPDGMPQTIGHPLHLAAYKGDERSAALLIRYGAEVDSRNSFGRTPLMLAVLTGKAETVEVLLRSGASARVRCVAGLSALDLARRRDSVKIKRLLRQYEGLAPAQ